MSAAKHRFSLIKILELFFERSNQNHLSQHFLPRHSLHHKVPLSPSRLYLVGLPSPVKRGCDQTTRCPLPAKLFCIERKTSRSLMSPTRRTAWRESTTSLFDGTGSSHTTHPSNSARFCLFDATQPKGRHLFILRKNEAIRSYSEPAVRSKHPEQLLAL